MKKLGLYIILLILCSGAIAQKITNFEIFIPLDSFVVGTPVDIHVSLLHDGKQDIRFPTADSTFGRFEWVGKQVFPTSITSDSLLLDSAIFKLRTFEMLDSMPLFLELYIGTEHVFETRRSNVLWIYNKDAVIKEFSNRLLTNDTYVRPPERVNYPLYWFLLSVLGGVVVLLLLFVLPQFIRGLRKKRFIAKHEAFVAAVSFDNNWKVEEWDIFIANWKKDMNSSKSRSYDAFTLQQLKTEFPDLKDIFVNLEGLLYNPKISENLTNKELDKLMRYAQIEYEVTLENWDR